MLSEAQKEAVLQECHSDPGSGKHNGIRSTRNTVVSTYYWSTITEDVKDWVNHVSQRFTQGCCFCTVFPFVRTREDKLSYTSLFFLSSGFTSYRFVFFNFKVMLIK